MRKETISILSTILFFAFACSNEEDIAQIPIQLELESDLSALNLPNTPFDYENIALPDHFRINSFAPNEQFQRAAIELDNTPANNPVTNEGATLGRVLFYDQKLSANGSVSCASCHKQELGFSDDEVLSEGFDGGSTRRHSMGLTNARFYSSGKFFWDERANTLEEQVLMPFQDPIEMGLSLDELEAIVSQQSYYPVLFEEAFGDPIISSDKIAQALAQFVRSMVSTNSRYDQARAEVNSPIADFPSFTAEENLGKSLFLRPRNLGNGNRPNCASCHVSEAFVAPIPNNGPAMATNATINGLDMESTDDLGVFESSNNPMDIGKFKVPSLRNIGVTAPYMHDGRFASLEEVVDFYSEGIRSHRNLRPPLLDQDGQAVQFDFTDREKDALVAFLHTLTDDSMLQDEKFSNPFRE